MTIGSDCEKIYGKNSLDYHLCKMYKKSGYLDKYGGSVIITVLTSIIFIIILGYFYIRSNIKQIKGNWPQERCHPLIIPFAGMINAPPGQSSGDYTAENFIGCISSILESIANVAMLPITYVQGAAGVSVGNLGINIDGLRNIMTYIRTVFENIISEIMGKTFNIFLALRRIIMKLKDSFGKVDGISSTLLYIGVSAVYAVFAFFWIFILIMFELVVFYILQGIYYLYYFFAPVPWFWGWYNIVSSVWAFLHALAILVPLIIVVINVDNIMAYTKNSPSRCFVGNTKIIMQHGEKEIKNIRLGDMLGDGGRITAIFKLSTYQQDLYNLDNILVTGEHMVYHNEKGFVAVSEHPSSLKISNYSHPYVYCINTTTKQIQIGNHIFLDWDEVDKIDILKLNLVAKKYLPEKANRADIHKYMDGGFVGTTKIELEDGRSIPIKDIVVNDQLRFGERVLGIVEIDTTTIDSIKEFIIKDRYFAGGPNLRINDKDLGIQSTLDIAGVQIQKPKKLYHILTDSKFLTVDGIQFFDYNGALEPILWNDSYNIIKPTPF